MLTASQRHKRRQHISFVMKLRHDSALSCTGHCAELFPYAISFQLTCFFEVQKNRCTRLGQPVIYLPCGLITTSPSSSPGRTNSVPGMLGSLGMLPNWGSKRNPPCEAAWSEKRHFCISKWVREVLGYAVVWSDRKWHEYTPCGRK